MKETLKQIAQVLGVLSALFGFTMGYTLMGVTIYKHLGDSWYTLIIGFVLCLACIFIGRALPKWPEKDERLDDLEQDYLNLKNKWYDRFGENL